MKNLFTVVFAFWSIAFCTPSTENWTAGTTDIQSFGVLHIGVDNYCSIIRPNQSASPIGFPTDAGLTLGILPFQKLQMELGVDFLEPSNDPFSANARLGTPEGKWSPAAAIGILGVGIKKDVTDLNVGYGVIGKTIPYLGRLFIGGYYGNDKIMGQKTNKGITLAYDRSFMTAKSTSGTDFNRLMLSADWASGNNVLGGGAVGLYFFFTENISLLTGPVWFNNQSINGDWKWTVQLDINTGKLF